MMARIFTKNTPPVWKDVGGKMPPTLTLDRQGTLLTRCLSGDDSASYNQKVYFFSRKPFFLYEGV